ncbi:M23 family metallopeptidase [Luteibacter yeojuensis]|uniref:M23 family metallopeptidase n=1 Tax=Luteibacter yeojuensis TaxID=345309 RepID=A0A7X5QYB4_9GAMM|nr:M23 family metallopeptidase [Luteibacter yeojuensis]NID17532.1 M23 family metallopeptidase [Luteibacter yeojuensis]
MDDITVMKKAAVVPLSLFVACIVAGLPAVAASAADASTVQAKVAVPPWPFPMAGKSWLVYELHLANTGRSPVEVVRLDAVDAAVPGDALAHWEGKALADRIALPGASQASPVLPPGAARIVYLEVPLRAGPPPRAIAHVVCFRVANDATAVAGCETGGRSVLATQPLPVLAPPVRKGPWVAVYTVAAPRGHRRVISSGDGSTGIPQRFAIDWMLVGEKGGLYRGDEEKVANWYGYGRDVLAVASGTVVDAHDGMAESPVLENRKYPGLEASGNFVSLSLGDGLYAHYEHLKPGSIRVRRGEHVVVGQVIGSLGYTGNSTGPHLHLHVSTGAGPMSGDGVPYLVRDATVVGRYASLDDFGKGLPWSHDGAEPATTAGRRPAEGAVVEFPGAGR